jgi:hypothetical protein
MSSTTTVSNTASTSPTVSPSTTVSSTASQSVSASASALPLNHDLKILTPSILTTNILFGPLQGRRLYLFGNNLTKRSSGDGKIFIEDDYYKGQSDRAQSPVTVSISSSTITCPDISSLARLSLGIFSTEPFCSNPLSNLTYFWNASSCLFSIVGRNRTAGSMIKPHNSSQFDYKELSNYFLCIEARFGDDSIISNAKFNVTISIKDLFTDARQNEAILKPTIFVDCIQYYANVSATGGSILPISKLSQKPFTYNSVTTYKESDAPILVFPPSILTSITFVGSAQFTIMQALVTIASPCSRSDILNFSVPSLQTFLSADGDSRSVQLIGSSFCGGLLEIRGAGTAEEYKALLNSLTFSTSSSNDLPSSVARNVTVSTTTQASLRFSPAYRYYDDFLSSFISVVPLNDLIRVPDGGSIVIANLSESDPPHIQVTITSNCSDEQVVSGFSATYVCLEDSDPIIGATNIRNVSLIASPQFFTQTSFYSISATSIFPNADFFFKSTGSESLDCTSPNQFTRSSISSTYWTRPPTPCWRQSFSISANPLTFSGNLSNVTITLQILDTFIDDENITGSQTLNVTSIFLRVDIKEIDKGGFPNVSSIEGVPLHGLSVYGGDVIDIVGTGLGNKDSANPIVKLVGGFGIPSPFTQWELLNSTLTGWELLNCTVINRAKRLRCITPPGYGQSLKCTVNVYGNVSLPSSATISYARPFVLGIAPWNDVSALVSGASNNISVGLLNSSYLSVLPTGGTGRGASQSLVGIEVTASGLPPMLTADAFNVSFVTGLNEMLSPRCLRPVGTTHLLKCLVPPGASASLEIKVSVAGVSSRPFIVSYANPRITLVYTSSNGYLLTIVGENFGSDQSPGAPCLDRVELLAEPFNSNLTDRCININYAPCLLKPHLALACSYVTAHTRIECALDPSSFGEFLSVRVIVAGLVSPWSVGTVSYPPPVISLVSVFNSSSTTPGATVTRRGLACNGGTRILISGYGFSAAGSRYFRLSIGGVPITYSYVSFVYSDASSPSAISNASDVILSSVSGVLTVMPPGFGAVSIDLSIGNRTGRYKVNYEPLVLSSISWLDGGLDTETRSINLFGTGMSMCALCLSNFSISTAADEKIKSNSASCLSSVKFGDENIGCAVPEEYRPIVSDYYKKGLKDLSGSIPNLITLIFTNKNGTTFSTSFSSSPRIIPFAFSGEGSIAALKFSNDGDEKFVDGTLSMQIKGASYDAASFNISFKNLLVYDPVIKRVSVSKLDPPAPWNITLSKAGGNGGKVVLRGGKSTTKSDLFFSIDCPTSWTTIIGRTIFGKVIDSLPAWNYTKQFMSTSYSDTNPSSFVSKDGAKVYLQLGDYTFPAQNCSCANFTITQDRKLELTDSNRKCANCFVTSYGLQSRVFWVYSSKVWTLSEKDLPCYVTTWRGDITWSGESDAITFVPPPWTGTANLTVNADGSESIDGVLVSFPSPEITSITPLSGSTRGELITITGTGFGLSDSALKSWYNMTSYKSNSDVEALGIKSPSNVEDNSDNYNSSIIVSYGKTEDKTSKRKCSVVSWSRTKITCKMPPGVPGSLNTITIQIRDLGSTDATSITFTPLPSKYLNYSYNLPTLQSAQVSDGREARTIGAFNVLLTGQNLGDSTLFAPDALTGESKWSFKIRVQGDSDGNNGLVNGLKDPKYIENVNFSSFTHESLTF